MGAMAGFSPWIRHYSVMGVVSWKRFVGRCVLVPLERPENLHIRRSTLKSTSVEFAWTAVDQRPERIRGFFKGYQVTALSLICRTIIYVANCNYFKCFLSSLNDINDSQILPTMSACIACIVYNRFAMYYCL